jgi:hypothetical protein
MNFKLIGLAVVLAAFLTETAFALFEVGYVGFFEAANANWATRLLMFDLVIALTLILNWMAPDARERGLRFWPWLLVTLTFGAAGPLGYLIRRELAGSKRSEAVPLHQS